MEKFQIVEVTEQLNHAGTKATADITVIAERLGFQRVNVKMDTTVDSVIGKARRQIGYLRDWKKAEKTITDNSILLLQHPFPNPPLENQCAFFSPVPLAARNPLGEIMAGREGSRGSPSPAPHPALVLGTEDEHILVFILSLFLSYFPPLSPLFPPFLPCFLYS